MVAYLKEVVSVEKDGIFKLDNAGNLWDDINYNNLANEAGLSFPNGQKPIQLLQRLIEMIDCQDGVILDFFSGSASTAHAVMQTNADDSGNRKFINPDWAIAFYEGNIKHIYFVAETKGSMNSMQLRLIEESKIHCAKEHFKAISNGNVIYDVVDSYQSLLDKVMK